MTMTMNLERVVSAVYSEFLLISQPESYHAYLTGVVNVMAADGHCFANNLFFLKKIIIILRPHSHCKSSRTEPDRV